MRAIGTLFATNRFYPQDTKNRATVNHCIIRYGFAVGEILVHVKDNSA